MSVKIIAATNRVNVIGRDGKIPWRNKTDMAHFKATTMGHFVLMGRKTWESIGSKPLTGRENLVLTRNAEFEALGARTVSDIRLAMEIAQMNRKDLFIIGGGEVYRQAWDFADELILTLVMNEEEEEGDTYFDMHPADIQIQPYRYDTPAAKDGEDAMMVMYAKVSQKTP